MAKQMNFLLINIFVVLTVSVTNNAENKSVAENSKLEDNEHQLTTEEPEIINSMDNDLKGISEEPQIVDSMGDNLRLKSEEPQSTDNMDNELKLTSEEPRNIDNLDDDIKSTSVEPQNNNMNNDLKERFQEPQIIDNILLPYVSVKHVIVTVTNTEPCESESKCSEIVESLQMKHMENNLTDIGYNFFVGGDGSVYSGQGWEVETSTFNWDSKSISIAFIGKHDELPFLTIQLQAMKNLTDWGVERNLLSKKFKLLDQRQLFQTEDFNDTLYLHIKNLEHWSEDVTYNAIRFQSNLCEIGKPHATQLIFSRNDWGAEGPKEELTRLAHPVKFVVISRLKNMFCNKNCSQDVRNFQRKQKRNGKQDIAYNFLISLDGSIYEGLGWNFKSQHLMNWDNNSIVIFLMVGYLAIFADYSLQSAKYIINGGVKSGKIREDHVVLYDRQISNGSDYNEHLYLDIKDLPHWNELNATIALRDSQTDSYEEIEIISQQDRHDNIRKRKLTLPMKYVTIVHVKQQENDIISDSNVDINNVNFLVDENGAVHEYLGWDYVSLGPLVWNNISISIRVDKQLSQSNETLALQLRNIQKLIEKGVKELKISEDYVVFDSRQWAESETGILHKSYEYIQDWSHWKPLNKTSIANNLYCSRLICKSDTQGHRIISRAEWKAFCPIEPIVKLSLPVKYVVVSHRGNISCSTQEECKLLVKYFQESDKSDGLLGDIAHNFLIGGDGNIYVGRNWDEEGAHTHNWNNISIGITVIGNSELPHQKSAIKMLTQLGIKFGKLRKDFIILDSEKVKDLNPDKALSNETENFMKAIDLYGNGPVDSTCMTFNSDNCTRIISREEWNAAATAGYIKKLNLPVNIVILSHTDSNGCDNPAKCEERMHRIQNYDTNIRNWAEASYNFYIGGDGNVYEGRGWDFQGSHLYKWTHDGLTIKFIGYFNHVAPKTIQLRAAQRLIEYGIKSGKISENYVVLCERQINKFDKVSHANGLYEKVQNWPHWSSINSEEIKIENAERRKKEGWGYIKLN